MWNGGLPINIPMCYPLKLWMWPDLEKKKKVFADVIKILEEILPITWAEFKSYDKYFYKRQKKT